SPMGSIGGLVSIGACSSQAPGFRRGVADEDGLQITCRTPSKHAAWCLHPDRIIVSFRMDKYGHRTWFAFLKGRLTTIAATSWPCGEEAACFCPAGGQAVAREWDGAGTCSPRWPRHLANSAVGCCTTHSRRHELFGRC